VSVPRCVDDSDWGDGPLELRVQSEVSVVGGFLLEGSLSNA